MSMRVFANRVMACGCAIASLFCASVAYGGLLVDFKPQPTSDLPELVFGSVGPLAPALRAGPGSQGNGDGTLLPANQTPGGLMIETPYAVPGLMDGKVANPDGTASFYDVTLSLTGLAVSAPAGGSGSLVYQPLGSGQFELTSTDGKAVLLNGYVSDAVIISSTQGQGTVLSAHIQYWGGEIFKALTQAEGLGNPKSLPGELSWSLLNMQAAPPMDLPGAYMPEFTADTVGQFSVTVPEPASLGLLAIGVLALLRRRV
jgi:hypothetical protein